MINHFGPGLWFQGAKWRQVLVCRYETLYLQATVGQYVLCCGNWTGALVKSLCGRSALKRKKNETCWPPVQTHREGILIRCARRWAGVASPGLVTWRLSCERSRAVPWVISRQGTYRSVTSAKGREGRWDKAGCTVSAPGRTCRRREMTALAFTSVSQPGVQILFLPLSCCVTGPSYSRFGSSVSSSPKWW